MTVRRCHNDRDAASIFDLKPGMTVAAEKIVEEPDTEITTDTKVGGQAPKAAAPAETPAEPAAAKTVSAPPAGTQPSEPESASSTNPLLWVGLVVVVVAIAVYLFRRSNTK